MFFVSRLRYVVVIMTASYKNFG